MSQVQLDEQVFEAAQRRAVAGGHSSVDEYIADVVARDLANSNEETPDLDEMFTPQVIAALERIAEAAKAGGKTYTSDEVREHFRMKSEAWESTEDHGSLHPTSLGCP